MSLLLQTDIDGLIKKHIRGHIARVGGSVNQLMDYQHCTVEDLNLLDGGFGDVRQGFHARNLLQFLLHLKRYVSQEIKFLRRGWKISRDRKTTILDLHHATQNAALKNRFDCSISSNMIEHSPNPIFLLLNFFYITKNDGYQYHAVPHYKYTYDNFRTPTDLAHIVSDFDNMIPYDDVTHHEDYIQSAIVKNGWQKEFHKKYPVTYPFIHFHVFDEKNTKELMEFIFDDVHSDILKTAEYSDNVILFKNRLNSSFLNTYQEKLHRLNIL